MAQKMTWNEIRQLYNREWIELVDYDWPEEDSDPSAGVVRAHASDRNTFYSLANREPRPKDSAILFVGDTAAPKGTIMCASLMRLEHAKS